MRHRIGTLLFIGSAWGATADAQDSRAELARRDLIERAEQARTRNDHAEALGLAERAAQIRQTPSLRLLLAQEHLAQDHLLAALAEGRACVREAEVDTTVRNRERMIGVCRALAESVEPRIAHVVVRFATTPPEDARVEVGGEPISTALLGVRIPVLPGVVAVHVSALNCDDFDRSTDVRAGAESEVVVAMRGRRANIVATVQPTGGGVGLRDDSTQGRRRSFGPAPWIVTGLGAAAIVSGGIVYWRSAAAASERDDICATPETCASTSYQRAVPLDERYRLLRPTGAVLLGAGAGALLTGLIWLAAGGSNSSSSPRATMTVIPTTSGVVVGVGGCL